ncbi:hypothetical protein, partial [Cetobacterium sp.]|uniref:hypothetical protein n=1 Tax=Cetobacterium sp. TaxID=2071632 RepID=UPI003EE75F1F
MSMLEKDEFCKEKIKIENIEHRLYQIAQKGKYFLKDIVFVKNIDISKCSFDEYYNIIKSFGIEAEIDDYKLKWTTIIQGYNILDEYSYILAKYSENWSVEFIVNLKMSEYEGNCGWEIYAEDINTNFHPWIYNQIKNNNLDISEHYTLSVDDLDNPKEIYIYSDKGEKLIIPYID